MKRICYIGIFWCYAIIYYLNYPSQLKITILFDKYDIYKKISDYYAVSVLTTHMRWEHLSLCAFCFNITITPLHHTHFLQTMSKRVQAFWFLFYLQTNRLNCTCARFFSVTIQTLKVFPYISTLPIKENTCNIKRAKLIFVIKFATSNIKNNTTIPKRMIEKWIFGLCSHAPINLLNNGNRETRSFHPLSPPPFQNPPTKVIKNWLFFQIERHTHLSAEEKSEQLIHISRPLSSLRHQYLLVLFMLFIFITFDFYIA